MPRPEKYDRVKKLVAFETGYYPAAITKKKDQMQITFGPEVTETQIPELQEKLKRCIPFEVTIIIKED